MRDCGKSLDIESLAAQGLDNDVIWLQIQNMCVRLASNNAEARLQELERFRVNYLQGEATLLPQEGSEGHKLLVKPVAGANDEITIETDNVLLCTGSFPTRMGNIPFDGSRIFDADSINGLGFLPKSVAVVGSGIIAIEYAKIFRKLGADVTMLVRGNAMSALQRIGLDETIAERLLSGLREDDVNILEGTQVKEFIDTDVDSAGCELRLDGSSDACAPLTIALSDKVSYDE